MKFTPEIIAALETVKRGDKQAAAEFVKTHSIAIESSIQKASSKLCFGGAFLFQSRLNLKKRRKSVFRGEIFLQNTPKPRSNPNLRHSSR